MLKRKRGWWIPLAHFLAHVIGGTAFFLVLCATSIGLALVMESVQANFEVPPLTFLVLTGLEQAIVIVDAMLFAVYLASTAVRVLREMLK